MQNLKTEKKTKIYFTEFKHQFLNQFFFHFFSLLHLKTAVEIMLFSPKFFTRSNQEKTLLLHKSKANVCLNKWFNDIKSLFLTLVFFFLPFQHKLLANFFYSFYLNYVQETRLIIIKSNRRSWAYMDYRAAFNQFRNSFVHTLNHTASRVLKSSTGNFEQFQQM